jgi:AcrR family transcriptional regulator
MYHHFADKTAVFAGVVNAELADVGQRMAKAAQANPDPIEQLILGGEAYVLAMAEPGRRRILLVEGASVLGTERIEALRGQHLKVRLEAGLRQIVAAGIVPELPIGPLADLLAALFDRIALVADRESFTGYRLALRALIGGLKAPSPASGDFLLV